MPGQGDGRIKLCMTSLRFLTPSSKRPHACGRFTLPKVHGTQNATDMRCAKTGLTIEIEGVEHPPMWPNGWAGSFQGLIFTTRTDKGPRNPARPFAFVERQNYPEAARPTGFNPGFGQARPKDFLTAPRGLAPASPAMPPPTDQPVFGVLCSCSSAKTPAIAFFGSLIWATDLGGRDLPIQPISIAASCPAYGPGIDPPPAAKVSF